MNQKKLFPAGGRVRFCLTLLLLFLLCVAPMLGSLYTYNRTHVSVKQENILPVSVKNTRVTQEIYCEGTVSNLGILFQAPSGPLYADAQVQISVTQNGRTTVETVPAMKLRTLSFYEKNPATQRETDDRYLMTYVLSSGLRLFCGSATVEIFSDTLPEGTDLFCMASSTVTSELPSAAVNGNYLGMPLVVEYDVFKYDEHFLYETVLLMILAGLLITAAWLLTFRRELLDRYEVLFMLSAAITATVVCIRNPYASLWGEPRSEATYEFWYKAEYMGLRGSLMSLMSGEALAWFERILMWIANKISPRKYVFTIAQMMELIWIALVTSLGCLRCFRRYFRDEIRLIVSLLLGTALLFDSAYYFWSCSYWALFFFLFVALLPMEKLPVWCYGLLLGLTAVLCVSRIYHILLVPLAVLALLLASKKRGARFRVFCGIIAVASVFEGCYSLMAGHSLTAGSSFLGNILEIGIFRMIENTLYFQMQVISSFFLGCGIEVIQGSGLNILACCLFAGIVLQFVVCLMRKEWNMALWIGGLGYLSLATIAVNVYTCGSYEYVSFPYNYAGPVSWAESIYQEADLHFSYAYICLLFLVLTMAYLLKQHFARKLPDIIKLEQLPACKHCLSGILYVTISAMCIFTAAFNMKGRLSFDRITVEWKQVFHITHQPDYFLAVNTFYGATPISLERNTDEMVYGLDQAGVLYCWNPAKQPYEMELPYQQAEVGLVSDISQKPVMAVTARRAMVNFENHYVAVLWDASGKELARVPQAQTDNRLWLDFLLPEPIVGVHKITFELENGNPAYIQDGLQVGYRIV